LPDIVAVPIPLKETRGAGDPQIQQPVRTNFEFIFEATILESKLEKSDPSGSTPSEYRSITKS